MNPKMEALFELFDKITRPSAMSLSEAIDFATEFRDELDMRIDALKNDQKNVTTGV